MVNNYLFANLLLSTSGEGDEATSPSCTTRYAAIQASNMSLEVLIASLLPTGVTTIEATFLMAMKLLMTVRSLFASADGERAILPSCTSIGTYNALL